MPAPAPMPVYVAPVTTAWKCPDPNCAICVAKRAASETYVKKTVTTTVKTGWVCPDPNCDICRRARGEFVEEAVTTEVQETPAEVQETPAEVQETPAEVQEE